MSDMNRDKEHFTTLLSSHKNIIYKIANSYSKSESDKSDLVQEITIQLWQAFPKYDERYKFSTWLYSFTYNHCVNYVQRDSEKKKPKVPIDSYLEKFTDDEIPDDSIFSLKSEKLKKVLELIDVNDKVVLLLKYQDDMSIKEIQETLGIGESAVKMRLKRAKERVLITYNNLL